MALFDSMIFARAPERHSTSCVQRSMSHENSKHVSREGRSPRSCHSVSTPGSMATMHDLLANRNSCNGMRRITIGDEARLLSIQCTGAHQ